MLSFYFLAFAQIATAQPKQNGLWPAELPNTAVVLPKSTGILRLFGDSSYSLSSSGSLHTSILDLKDKLSVQYRHQLIRNQNTAFSIQPGGAFLWSGSPNFNLTLLYTALRPKNRFTITAGGEMNPSFLDLLMGKTFAFPMSVQWDILKRKSAHRLFLDTQLEDVIQSKTTFTLGYVYSKTLGKRI